MIRASLTARGLCESDGKLLCTSVRDAALLAQRHHELNDRIEPAQHERHYSVPDRSNEAYLRRWMNFPKRAAVVDGAGYGQRWHNRDSCQPNSKNEPRSAWCRRRKHQARIHNPALM